VSGRRILAIARRIAEQFRRDRPTLALVFVAPIVVLALLGWVLRDQTAPPTRLAVINQAGQTGGIIGDAFTSAATRAGITVIDLPAGETSSDAIRADRADVVVNLIPGAAGTLPTIQIVTPGLSPGDDSARFGRLQEVIASLIGNGGPQITHATVYGSGNGDALDAFAPALVGFFGFFFVFILTGISFLRERIGGTLERLLATPVARGEIVVGYSAGFALFAALQVTLILAFTLSGVAFDVGVTRVAIGLGVPIAGNPLLAFVMVVLLAVGAVNLGIFLSTFARTELQILQFIPIVVVPQALLGGVLWSVSSLPGPLQPIARVLPLTYAIDGLRNVLVKGIGLESGAVQLDLVILAGFAVFFVAIAALTIRREVA
jgi:ABC-2 type transport system permease protein